MAFVSRANRTTDFSGKNNGLGPGSYIGHSEYRVKHLYSPRLSLVPTLPSPPNPSEGAKRKTPSLQVSPPLTKGPGHYSPPRQFDKEAKQGDQPARPLTGTTRSPLDSSELGVLSFLKSQPIGFSSGADRFKGTSASKSEIPGNVFWDSRAGKLQWDDCSGEVVPEAQAEG